MFLAIPPFHDHMGPMRQRDADHSVDMVHIYAPDIISREWVVKQGKIPKVSPFEACFTVCFWILVSFHSIFSHLFQIIKRAECYETRSSEHPFTHFDKRCLCVYISMMNMIVSITFL